MPGMSNEKLVDRMAAAAVAAEALNTRKLNPAQRQLCPFMCLFPFQQ
jgi:hypothetical protein